MSELTLFVFRIAFLIALWVFVFFVVYAVRSDLFGQRVRRLNPIAAPSAPDASAFLTQAHSAVTAASSDRVATGLDLEVVITAGPKAGERVPLGSETLTIGRSPDSRLVIRDDYTSTRHASIGLRNGTWILTDLDSTNGTFMGGARISGPVPVTLNTPIAVGQTTFEIRDGS